MLENLATWNGMSNKVFLKQPFHPAKKSYKFCDRFYVMHSF